MFFFTLSRLGLYTDNAPGDSFKCGIKPVVRKQKLISVEVSLFRMLLESKTLENSRFSTTAYIKQIVRPGVVVVD